MIALSKPVSKEVQANTNSIPQRNTLSRERFLHVHGMKQDEQG
jgi:hypothetical protein